MILLRLNEVSKQYAGQYILRDIQFEVKTEERIAIVGRNGVGKSTLLKIMTDELNFDIGDIYKAKNVKIGYLKQQMNIHSKRTIWDEMLTIFADLIQEQKEIERLAHEIERQAQNGYHDEKLIQAYGRKQELFEKNGGYRFESDIRGVLNGLGFHNSTFHTKINHLSGGQKTRIALGKLLLKKPDILFLDEPTNHLDIASLNWLEQYLINYPGAVVIVSHDRYFLDKIVSIVYEIRNKQMTKYFGTYTQFLQQRKENYKRELQRYEEQQKEIKRAKEFIERNIARASTSRRAQSRRKQLERLEKIDQPFNDLPSAKLSFDIKQTSGNDVLDVRQLSFRHDENRPLLNDISFHIQRGERVALIGENGVGKTTLLDLIYKGHKSVYLGANVQIGYYRQEQETLDPNNTVLQELWNAFPSVNEQKIRTVLGNFLFTGDDVLKSVQSLSGGEKARLALAKLMLQRANFLILDEPTNHLDLDSKEVLEDALLNFPGTILFVSHDRYFINKIADMVLELTKEGTMTYLGNYDYYLDKKMEQEEISRLNNPKTDEKTKTTTKRSQQFAEQKRMQSERRRKKRKIKAIEDQIEANENKITKLELKMTEPDILQDHEYLLELSEEVEQLKLETDELLEKWTSLNS